jgi:hypothetical protein
MKSRAKVIIIKEKVEIELSEGETWEFTRKKGCGHVY